MTLVCPRERGVGRRGRWPLGECLAVVFFCVVNLVLVRPWVRWDNSVVVWLARCAGLDCEGVGPSWRRVICLTGRDPFGACERAAGVVPLDAAIVVRGVV